MQYLFTIPYEVNWGNSRWKQAYVQKKKEIKGVDTNAIKESLAKCIPIRYIT